MLLVPSSDGVTVAVHDLGGSGPPLLLAHATGFHAHVLEPLAQRLAEGFHCWGVDSRGHGDSMVPQELDWTWSHFGDDILAASDVLGLERPFGFGHSAGGAALLTAESARPGSFASLYCFEPVVWSPPAPLDHRHALVEGARRRREVFSGRQEARANYASKPPFNSLDPAALDAYVDHGFEDLDDGTVRLKCRRENEAEVYRAGLVYDGFSRLGEVTCPVVVARGERSDAITPGLAVEQAQALSAGRLEVIPGLGHFGPMEDPDKVAASVAVAFSGR